jgi:hypothetical protein
MYRFKISVIIALVIVVSSHSIAQKLTKSPYSVYGLGELNNGEYATFMAMGNALTATTDSTVVNQNNPASYAYISRYRPLFQIALNGKFSKFSDANNASKANQLGLNQFQLGFPVLKNWGGSFGLTPFSSTGYLITSSNIVDGDTISQKINEGTGTISQFHVGTAYKHKFKHSQLSIGMNARYLFGSSTKIQSFEYAQFVDYGIHSRVERATRIKSLTYDFGAIFEKQFSKNSFAIGLTYSPQIKIKAKQDILSYAYYESFYNNFNYFFDEIDTVENTVNDDGVINLPAAYKFGGEFRFQSKADDKTSLMILKADLKYQEWSKYYEEFNGFRNDSIFKDRLSTSLGFQFSPHTGRQARNNIIPWFGKLHYRIGVDYTLSQLYVNSVQLTNYGISFGLGIPVPVGNSNTNINLGAKFGSLGTTQNNLIKEDYIGVYFGVTISPGFYDRWFLKRKYD